AAPVFARRGRHAVARHLQRKPVRTLAGPALQIDQEGIETPKALLRRRRRRQRARGRQDGGGEDQANSTAIIDHMRPPGSRTRLLDRRARVAVSTRAGNGRRALFPMVHWSKLGRAVAIKSKENP